MSSVEPNAAALASLREIVGPEASDEVLNALLLRVGDDVTRAAEHYFGDEPMIDAATTTVAPLSIPSAAVPSYDQYAIEALKELLNNSATDEELRDLLTRSHGNVSEAVDLHFLDKASQCADDSIPLAAPSAPPPPPVPTSVPTEVPHKVMHTNEEYEVELTDGALKWTIGNVLGRIVVQDVVVGGAAHKANIQKADVLIACSGHVIKESNVAPIVTRLSKEVVNVPVLLRFRRADHTHSGHHVAPVEAPPVASTVQYGIHIMANALKTMRQAASDVNKYPPDLLLQHYVWSEGNVALAMDQLLHPIPLFPNFDRVVGYEWYANDGKVNHADPSWPLYDATFPAGPMGITVENVHERTIIVNVKDGASGSRANVTVDSWLVAINGECITHLTHHEALNRIRHLPRPLLLTFCVTPAPWLPALKQMMGVNVRMVQPNDRHELVISDDDRTSFGRFQRKLLGALRIFPSVACEILHLAGQNPAYDDDVEYIPDLDGTETKDGAAARRALISMIHGMGMHADKGESVVLNLVRGLTVLGLWCVRHHSDTADPTQDHLWWILHLVLDVFENGSVMEKSSTWDAIVDSLKVLGAALSPTAFLRTFPPLVARLSLYSSPSSRIIPLALMPLVYSRVDGDLRVQFRGLFDRLTMDDAPLVRRAAAYILPALARAVGPESISWVVLLIEKMCADHSDLVRLYAVQAIAELADSVNAVDDAARRLVRCELVPRVNAFVTDTDWQIRHQTVTLIPQFISVLGIDFADVLIDHFVELSSDANMEVRIAAAKASIPISMALSADLAPLQNALDALALTEGETKSSPTSMHAKVPLSILPAFESMSRDTCASVRRAVAASLTDAMSMLGSNRGDVLEPMIKQLLADKDSVVAQSVVEQLMAASMHLSGDLEALVVTNVEKLSKLRPWRSRLLAVESIQKWAKSPPPSLVMIALGLLHDAVCQVRLGAVNALVHLTASCGPAWFQSTGLAPVVSLLDQSYQLQLTGLHACLALARQHLLDASVLDPLFDHVVIAATTSRTSNIRFKAVEVLAAFGASVPPAKWNAVRPTLLASCGLERDDDVRAVHRLLAAFVGPPDATAAAATDSTRLERLRSPPTSTDSSTLEKVDSTM
ncbi:hypothetical protein H310_11062 [Aphanomyces invadans]|uniref:PDZ domain-containing protein n=1 Tax=Aphanomyces invadans TaxID=157072 RepID=A0A024TNA6_9STRA|nr:hypothetical protein H310_11062 [Aphanomyces invadans]ETV95640.1 hypothetical protein H310_11062 [Aphanomyces invadans]|eukprot:XP_008875833.1 hypothetical protein H310_11062 [Aphanomyces invadans]